MFNNSLYVSAFAFKEMSETMIEFLHTTRKYLSRASLIEDRKIQLVGPYH